MSYQDLVDLDNRTNVITLPYEKVEFDVRRNEDTDTQSLHAKFGDHDIRVSKSDRHFETLCGAFNVPHPFAGTVPADLLATIFRTRAEQNTGVPYNWAVDTTSNELIACGSPRKPYIPFSRAGELLKNLGLIELDGELTRNGMGEITATHPERALIEPRVGDISKSGVNLRMNNLNEHPPEILPWCYRLWCSNGMSSREERERVKVVGHDVDDVLEQIESIAERAFSYAERINNRFADMVDHEVNPVEGMHNLLASHNIPVRMHENLLAQAASLPEDQHTMYDVLNVFTRFATGTHDPIRRLDLQVIGGDVAIVDHLNCDKCGHQLD